MKKTVEDNKSKRKTLEKKTQTSEDEDDKLFGDDLNSPFHFIWLKRLIFFLHLFFPHSLHWSEFKSRRDN